MRKQRPLVGSLEDFSPKPLSVFLTFTPVGLSRVQQLHDLPDVKGKELGSIPQLEEISVVPLGSSELHQTSV